MRNCSTLRGTLTRGEHVLADLATTDVEPEELPRLTGAVEADSEHPLARAIHADAADWAEVPPASGFRSMTGRGVAADAEEVAVGGPALLRDRELDTPRELQEHTDRWTGRGAAVLHVIPGGRIIGAIALEDEVREISRQAVQQLHAAGVTVAMVTGDAQQVDDAVARELEIDGVFAEALPEDKDTKVTELQERGLTVAMVGDFSLRARAMRHHPAHRRRGHPDVHLRRGGRTQRPTAAPDRAGP